MSESESESDHPHHRRKSESKRLPPSPSPLPVMGSSFCGASPHLDQIGSSTAFCPPAHPHAPPFFVGGGGGAAFQDPLVGTYQTGSSIALRPPAHPRRLTSLHLGMLLERARCRRTPPP
jgi:hypothetical protein